MTALVYIPRNDQRLLWICIASSMVLHTLVLWNTHPIESAPAPSTQIKASIRLAAPPAPAPAAALAPVPEPPKPETAPEPPKPPPLPEAAKAPPKAPVTESPKARTAESKAPTAAPTPAAPAAPAEAKPAPPAAALTPATPNAPAASAPATPGADAELSATVRGYQSQLAVVAQKFKRYPSEAMEKGWEGTAQLRVHIGADGKIAGIDLISSTGQEMLDEQAKITVNKAKPNVPIPPPLRGVAFDADIRVVFSLKN